MADQKSNPVENPENDAEELKLPMNCECDSFKCSKYVLATEEEMLIALHRDTIVIIDGCEYGPRPTDVFLEKREGYTIYKAG